MIVNFSGVTKQYPQHSAISDLSFELEPGTITALIGVNGAGKTTTMEVLMGHLHKKGQVSLWDKEMEEISSAFYPGRIYYVPENKALPCDLILEEMLEEITKKTGPSLNIDIEHMNRLMEKMGLDRYRGQKISHLSQGQRSGLYILLGLASNAELLVLDEPLSGLDPYIRNLIIDELKSSSWEGRTVFYSSHILEEVERVADKVIILHQGRNLYEGSIDELKEKYFEIILENPEDLDSLLQNPGVVNYRTQEGGIVTLFIEKEKYNGDIAGKTYLLNLKEIFLYLIDVKKTSVEE